MLEVTDTHASGVRIEPKGTSSNSRKIERDFFGSVC